MAQPSGLFTSISTLLGTLLGIAQTRIELLANELEEQRMHFVTLVFYGMLMLFFFGVGLILITLLIISFYWDTHRMLALCIVSASYMSIALAFAIAIVVQVRRKPKLFTVSLSELNKDRDALESVE